MDGTAIILHTPTTQGEAEVATVTQLFHQYRRRTGLQGGFLEGSAFLWDTSLGFLQDWFYSYLFGHIEERTGGLVTWEGYIEEMSEPAPHVLDERDGYRMDIVLNGYVSTCNDRYISAGDGSDGNVSAWINAIVTTDLEFIGAGRINTNTLQVSQEVSTPRRAWDEIARVTELGDASGNPWRTYIDADKKLYYEQILTTPVYYAYGGLRRRRARSLVLNYIYGNYTDTANAMQTIGAAINTQSVSRYGRREEKLFRENLPTAIAEALRDTQLKENAWPWPRVARSDPGVELYTGLGQNVGTANPYLVRPGVVRDMTYPVSGQEYSGWLSDIRDTLIEEVEVNDGKLVLTTGYLDKASLLQAQLAYAADEGESDYDLSD